MEAGSGDPPPAVEVGHGREARAHGGGAVLPLTLTFDHAVVDGAPAARFTETLRWLVESAAAFEDGRRDLDGRPVVGAGS